MIEALRKPLLLAALLALGGCVTLPGLKQSKPDIPAAWPDAPAQESDAAKSAQALLAPDWWKVYGDPVLDTLEREALAHNQDLLLAAARIQEAKANLGLTRADRFPEVTANVGAERSRSTERGNFTLPNNPGNTYDVGIQAAYEADLWGRYREATQAARADLLATEYAREVVRATLTTDVARGYFALRALDAQVALAEETIANRRAAVEINTLRYEGGIASELELRQAEAELAATQASLASLSGQRRQQELALAVLLGRAPRQILESGIDRGNTLAELTPPPAIPAGLPSDLLLRRPDLRQADQKLLAAHARIGEARAALYPNLSLTANLGSESKRLADLFSAPATVWGLAASLAQTVYNAGRTEAAVEAADARQTQALVEYEQGLRQAFREVLDALVAHRQAREQASAHARQAEAVARTLELAELRYKNGVDNYLQVLDAQRGLYAARQSAVDARRAQLAASADLVKALGGGWEGRLAEATENPPETVAVVR